MARKFLATVTATTVAVACLVALPASAGGYDWGAVVSVSKERTIQPAANPECLKKSPKYFCASKSQRVPFSKYVSTSAQWAWFKAHNTGIPADATLETLAEANTWYAVSPHTDEIDAEIVKPQPIPQRAGPKKTPTTSQPELTKSEEKTETKSWIDKIAEWFN